jgi:hypothetical protein
MKGIKKRICVTYGQFFHVTKGTLRLVGNLFQYGFSDFRRHVNRVKYRVNYPLNGGTFVKKEKERKERPHDIL